MATPFQQALEKLQGAGGAPVAVDSSPPLADTGEVEPQPEPPKRNPDCGSAYCEWDRRRHRSRRVHKMETYTEYWNKILTGK